MHGAVYPKQLITAKQELVRCSLTSLELSTEVNCWLAGAHGKVRVSLRATQTIKTCCHE